MSRKCQIYWGPPDQFECTNEQGTNQASPDPLNVPAKKMSAKYGTLEFQHGADSCSNTRAKNTHMHDYEYGVNTDEYNAKNE